MNQLELAWAAGFFDGEGWIGRDKNRVRLSISQNDRRPLDRFAQVVGCGIVNGPYKHTNGTPFYQYRAYARNVRLVMGLLLPYLSDPKREQYADALFAVTQVAA